MADVSGRLVLPDCVCRAGGRNVFEYRLRRKAFSQCCRYRQTISCKSDKAGQIPSKESITHLERIVQVLQHDDALVAVRPQPHASQSDTDGGSVRAAAQDEDDATLFKEALHADERLGGREVDACAIRVQFSTRLTGTL